MVQQVVDIVTSTLLASQEPEPQAYEIQEPQVHAANAAQQSHNLLPSLLQQMQQMQIMMMEMQRTMGNNSQAAAPNPGPRNPRRSKYCWTHGRGGHISADCMKKAPNYQDATTFENRMGGSNRGCG